MANLKSTAITNRDTVPAVINDGRLERGVLKSAIGFVTAGASDTGGASYAAGSTYVCCSLPSSAIVRQVLISSVAMTSGAVSVGVARNTRDSGGTAYPLVASGSSIALFASAQSVAALLNKAEITNQSGNYTLDKQEQPLWQAAGMTADPMTTLDIVILVTTTVGTGGRIGLEVRYVDNGS